MAADRTGDFASRSCRARATSGARRGGLRPAARLDPAQHGFAAVAAPGPRWPGRRARPVGPVDLHRPDRRKPVGRRPSKTTLPRGGRRGVHTWRVVATDRRGQRVTTALKPRRSTRSPHGSPPPSTRSAGERSGADAADASAGRPRGGVGRADRFGDGSVLEARKAEHVYPRGLLHGARDGHRQRRQRRGISERGCDRRKRIAAIAAPADRRGWPRRPRPRRGARPARGGPPGPAARGRRDDRTAEAARRSGPSVGLGHPADRALLRELRTAADAILVGAATMPPSATRGCWTPTSARCVPRAARGAADRHRARRGSTSRRHPVLAEPGVAVHVYTEAEPPPVDGCAADLRSTASPPAARRRPRARSSSARRGIRSVAVRGRTDAPASARRGGVRRRPPAHARAARRGRRRARGPRGRPLTCPAGSAARVCTAPTTTCSCTTVPQR